MNPEAKARLDEILGIAPTALNKDQIEFLVARRDYLNKAQREEYKEVIDAALKAKQEPVSKSETKRVAAQKAKQEEETLENLKHPADRKEK